MINFNLKSFFKDNVIPLSITLIIIIYFIYTWIFYYQGYDFNMFLLNYFSKIVDFTEYFFPVKYIAAYIRGEATWEVAQPYILRQVGIQNLISSLTILLLYAQRNKNNNITFFNLNYDYIHCLFEK